MSEISINTVEYIDEVEQIILLTTCATKLHRYYRVTLHSLYFPQKWISKNPPQNEFRKSTPSFINPPFITFARACTSSRSIELDDHQRERILPTNTILVYPTMLFDCGQFCFLQDLKGSLVFAPRFLVEMIDMVTK